MTADKDGRLKGKVALISGAASGLGRAAALAMAQEGAAVALGDIDRVGTDALAREIGGGAEALALDVTDESQWIGAVGRAQDRFGGLDILVNSAGVIETGTVEETTLADWRKVMAVNLDGTFLGCKHALLAMKTNGEERGSGGSIINMSSVSGLVGGANIAAYNASKGGVRLLTKSVALHCAQKGYGVRCNSVHPAFIDTPLVDGLVAAARDETKARARIASQIPLGRIGRPEDLTPLLIYLASDESKFVTGAEFVIDGGLTAQ
jgi:3(or 17)beta-hydroxysteroid dehydrogenase